MTLTVERSLFAMEHHLLTSYERLSTKSLIIIQVHFYRESRVYGHNSGDIQLGGG